MIVDDKPEHLDALAAILHRCGMACLPIHFTGEVADIPRCPHVRVLFADLHLITAGAGTTNDQHFGTIVSLLEDTLAPEGPYAIVLWTQHAEQAAALSAYLEQRLAGVQKPFAVIALDKTQHLTADGEPADSNALVAVINQLLNDQPQFAALFDWEERILGAAAETVSTVVKLATGSVAPDARAAAIGRLLFYFGLEAVGAGNVERDRFRAVNEALLPILADRVAALRADERAELWERALRGQTADAGMSAEEAAKLNKLVHIATESGLLPSERGAVSLLPPDRIESFESFFGMAPADAASKQFGCVKFEANNTAFRWVLVQTQAICDYAQSKPGPLPFVLGLEMPATSVTKDSLPDAIPKIPHFDLGAGPRALHLNARFQMSLSRTDAADLVVAYRLRESLIDLAAYDLHGYGARPGLVSFHLWKEKRKTEPKAG